MMQMISGTMTTTSPSRAPIANSFLKLETKTVPAMLVESVDLGRAAEETFCRPAIDIGGPCRERDGARLPIPEVLRPDLHAARARDAPSPPFGSLSSSCRECPTL